MKLYYTPGVCSQAPHIVLREDKIDFELIKVDLASKKASDGTHFLELNPLGYVLVLAVRDGFTLREGPAIMQYVADLVPEKRLLPPHGTVERYRAQEWLNFLTTEVHKGFVPLIYHRKTKRFGDFASFNKTKLEKSFSLINEGLGKERFVLGGSYTAVDSYLWVLCNWAKAPWIRSVFDADVDLSRFAALHEWYERVKMRPAVTDAVEAEGMFF